LGEKVPSLIKGYRYAGVFIERKSRYKESYFAVHKDTSTLCQIIRNWDREHLSRWKYIYLTSKQLDNFFFHLKCDNLEYRIPEILDLITPLVCALTLPASDIHLKMGSLSAQLESSTQKNAHFELRRTSRMSFGPALGESQLKSAI
jgi:hypothetical protein